MKRQAGTQITGNHPTKASMTFSNLALVWNSEDKIPRPWVGDFIKEKP